MDSLENLIVMYWPLLIDFSLKLLTSVVIFVVGKFIARRIKVFLSKALQLRKIDPTVETFIANVSYYLLLTLVIVIVLSQLGVQTASLVAVLGAMGLAVGLALQGSLSNFASGVLLIVLRPCKIGDFVEAGGEAGTITAVDILATTMTTPDNKVIVIPNSQIMGRSIINYSAMDTRRVDLMIGVAYDTDLSLAKQVLLELCHADDRIHKDPDVVVGVKELGDSSINILVRFWVDRAEFWNVQFDLQHQIVDTFRAKAIEIPFPQVDVHLDK